MEVPWEHPYGRQRETKKQKLNEIECTHIPQISNTNMHNPKFAAFTADAVQKQTLHRA